MPFLKGEVPSFQPGESTSQRMQRMLEYLLQLRLELDFIFRNLNGGNLNGAGLDLTVRSADGSTEYGHIGAVGAGVGLQSGLGSVQAGSGGVSLMYEKNGIRVTQDGVETTDDGGETWAPLKGGEEA